ncbi:hypothetical protein [Legionella fairfieldensis]|uniref:hypothetical protein n=1 Tax=Legionella fairfieldensis TaxID=45064 RepID=UPI0004908587|nr:hypothetical protein [Legionella fairfieldensis]
MLKWIFFSLSVALVSAWYGYKDQTSSTAIFIAKFICYVSVMGFFVLLIISMLSSTPPQPTQLPLPMG